MRHKGFRGGHLFDVISRQQPDQHVGVQPAVFDGNEGKAERAPVQPQQDERIAVAVKVGVVREPVPMMYNLVSVLLGEIVLVLPYCVLVIAAVLHAIDPSLQEAARGLGASRTRIVARHLFPHIAPYAFAQLIFFAPTAILAEAGLSFLGLGDPSIPTWGQILEAGFRTGAVFLGYWW